MKKSEIFWASILFIAQFFIAYISLFVFVTYSLISLIIFVLVTIYMGDDLDKVPKFMFVTPIMLLVVILTFLCLSIGKLFTTFNNWLDKPKDNKKLKFKEFIKNKSDDTGK